MRKDNDDFERALTDARPNTQTPSLDGIRDRVEPGIKRLAKALRRVSPGLKHIEAIESVAAALGFNNWHAVDALLKKGRELPQPVLSRLRVAANCPLPPYERPDSDTQELLKRFGARLAKIHGISAIRVLDEVLAYAYEADSFDELISRDSCVATPAYAVDEHGELVLTHKGQVAIRAVGEECRRLQMVPDQLHERLEAIVMASPDNFAAWSALLWREFSRSHAWGGSVRGAGAFKLALENVLKDVRAPIRNTAEGMTELASATHAAVLNFVAAGAPDDAYHLCFLLDSALARPDSTLLDYWSALLCQAGEEDDLRGVVEEHALLDSLAEGVELGDMASLLSVGMVALVHGAYKPEWAFTFIVRANLVSRGEMRKALAGRPNNLLDDWAHHVWCFRKSNLRLCRDVASALTSSSMRSSERAIAKLDDEVGTYELGTLALVEGEQRLSSEIHTRARLIAREIAASWKKPK